MKTETDIHISDLRASLNGEVIGAQHPSYDNLRRVFFTGFDRRPAVIVRAADASDVARVVTLARESGVELAIRSGGHSRAGHGTSDGGIVLDLSALNALEIDADGRAAWAQTGISAGDYTRRTGERGLATGLGDTASVGLGGITLCGGMGFLVRKHGLTIDDVLAAEVVTASGEILGVEEQAHSDLFWALRGGGGNFGVVTRLRLRLHEINQVVGGMLVLPATADVITGIVAAADAAPEELTVIANVLKAPPLPFIAPEQHGKPVVMAVVVYAGAPAAGEKALAPLRALATPFADMVRPIHYPEMYGPESPGPAFDVGTNMLVDELPAGGAETILAHLETASAALAAVQLRVLGGAMARVGDGATAFGHRRARLMVNISARDQHVEKRAEHEAWASGVAEALSGGARTPAYVAFIGDEGEEGVRRAYPAATLQRLAQVKRRYDPDNLLHLNVNVTPDMKEAPDHKTNDKRLQEGAMTSHTIGARVDRELEPFISMFPRAELNDPITARKNLAELSAKAPAPDIHGIEIEDRTVSANPNVPVRIYRPHGMQGGIVWLHGGGFVMGGLDVEHPWAARIADVSNTVVVSVGYRLAPEHRFPAALDDAYAVVLWTAEHAVELGFNPQHIAVGGHAAGAGLAAAVALRARDQRGPAIAFQLLNQPELDDRQETWSARNFTNTPFMTRDKVSASWRHYLGAAPASPYAAPARASDLSGLPAAYIATAEFDPNRDEAIVYAQRLMEAGVPVELHQWRGTFHGSQAVLSADVSQRQIAELGTVLHHALAG